MRRAVYLLIVLGFLRGILGKLRGCSRERIELPRGARGCLADVYLEFRIGMAVYRVRGLGAVRPLYGGQLASMFRQLNDRTFREFDRLCGSPGRLRVTVGCNRDIEEVELGWLGVRAGVPSERMDELTRLVMSARDDFMGAR